ncbi:MAG: hypothetical protein RQ847_05670 [Wenzhouxiangellaceae bacterium]|nr:hypothetical protein [Wenzhouxiangellaceae bacterium]
MQKRFLRKLLVELKRRNIFRAAATYAISAWVLAQAAGLVLPAFETPDWMLRTVFVLLALGLPVTIVAAWLYEITPRGLRRHGKATDGEPSASGGPRVVDSVIIIALVFAVILVGIGRDGWLIGLELITAEDVTTLLDAQTEERRIALFPFASVNSDLDGRLVAEGFALELAERLQAAPALGVIGMASTFELERRRDDSNGASEVLGVERIVEGSVRRDGETLTVTAQLVRAADRAVLVTHTEEIPLAEIGEALERIAKKLASANEVRPGDAHKFGFSNAGAIDWLRIRASLQRGGAENLHRARELAAGLSDQVSDSGEARAAHGIALLRLAEIESTDFAARANKARALLDQAISLAPQSRQVLRWRALAESQITRWRGQEADFRRVLGDLDRALELFPNDPVLLGLRACHCAAFGDYPCAAENGRAALAYNPLDYELNEAIVDSLLAMGRLEQAAQQVEQLRRRQAASGEIGRLDAKVAAARGEFPGALRQLDEVDRRDRETLLLRLQLLASGGNLDKALSLLESENESIAGTLPGAWKATLNGDFASAYEEARKALDPNAPGHALILGQIAAQAGAFDDAADTFDRHFSSWIKDSGPLLGRDAWTYAPWYALALRETDRAHDARRLLDRHLAGVLAVESSLEAVRRNLYLAANHAVNGRAEDAILRLDQALASGLNRNYGVLGGLQALADSRVLGEAASDPKLALAFERAGTFKAAPRELP